MKRDPYPGKFMLVLASLLMLLFFANILLGSVKIPLPDALSILTGHQGGSTWAEIIWQFRLPKAITCILAGAALASSGLMMQTLFRNPLAGPDVLGLSAGASLFVAAIILVGTAWPAYLFQVTTHPWSVAAAACAGSTMIFLLVITIARRVRDNISLLIIGLMISASTSSVVSVLQFLSKADDLQAFMIWTLGSVGATGWREIQVMLVILIVGTVIAFRSIKPLNALLLGEHYAQSLGVNIRRSRFWIVCATSIMVGAVTAFCGPIAFVGIAVPHLIRRLLHSSNHKILLPAAMIGGAALILFCDILSHLPGNSQVLPLNAITSLIGAPVVIWVVMKGGVKN